VSVAAGKTLWFDSSFNHPGGALRNIRFAPMSANDWASIGGVNITTSQIGSNQVTESINAKIGADVLAPDNTNETVLLTVGTLDSAGSPILVTSTLVYHTGGNANNTYTLRFRYNNLVVHSTVIQSFAFGTFLDGHGTFVYSRNFTIPSPAPGGHVLTVSIQPQSSGIGETFTLLASEYGGTEVNAVALKR
jgi:hypothetical protein